MNVLVINAGSSSIKYHIFDMNGSDVLASGLAEKIGESHSRLKHCWRTRNGTFNEKAFDSPLQDHRQALYLITDLLRETVFSLDSDNLLCIAHRVVHGGSHFTEPALLTEHVVETIKNTIDLAPLHNPANLAGIEVTRALAANVPQVAVFDTSFHYSIPISAHLYAVPFKYYEQLQVRRYGFHGISHQYVTKEVSSYIGIQPQALNLISLHLGNGASVTAIKNGNSVDTSMGMTPLEGLIMGTRCGDLDPSLAFYLEKKANLSNDEISHILNFESGLKGICGVNDMREIQKMAAAGDNNAQIAIDSYCYRIKKYIGAYFAVLGRVDAVTFTGGIGENAALIRELCCQGLEHLGIALDSAKNSETINDIGEIQQDNAKTKILVVHGNEELEIARQSIAVLERASLI